MIPSFNVLARSRTWDIATRVVSAGCLALLGMAAVAAILSTLRQLDAGGSNARLISTLVVNICIFLLMVIETTLVIGRPRAVAKASGMQARVCALAGTWIIFLLVLLPVRTDLSITAYRIAAVLTTLGDLLAIYVVMTLGGSFSIMAEARRMVEHGPYAIVRHPLYLAEEIALAGAILTYLSWQALALLALQLFFQYRRARNEERILASTFPAYLAYLHRTPMWLPSLAFLKR